jgi:hypothetical protein
MVASTSPVYAERVESKGNMDVGQSPKYRIEVPTSPLDPFNALSVTTITFKPSLSGMGRQITIEVCLDSLQSARTYVPTIRLDWH